jgi:hypothetical protein
LNAEIKAKTAIDPAVFFTGNPAFARDSGIVASHTCTSPPAEELVTKVTRKDAAVYIAVAGLKEDRQTGKKLINEPPAGYLQPWKNNGR